MKYFVAWILSSILVLGMFFGAPVVFADEPMAAQANTCTLTYAVKEGNAITITVCDQNFTFDINDAANGALGEVTLPPIPPVTITLPAPPPVTVTDHVPQPGSTTTVTNNMPGPTSTATIVRPPETVTVAPTATETDTRILTVTETVTRQPETTSATMGAEPDQPSEPGIEEVIRVVGIGLLTLLALGLFAFLTMLWGYYLGRKDRERSERTFLSNILNYAVRKRIH